MITLEGVSKSYQDGGNKTISIIEKLDFTFPQHGVVAIVGMSGVGKSTLLQLLGGLDKPTAGKIKVADTDLTALSGDNLSNFRGDNIGFVFQFHHLLPEFTAAENVAMPLTIAGVPDAEASHRAEELLALVGLQSRSTHLPKALSGGEQQRVAIARALVTNPSLVLLDEPTGNLDVQSAQVVTNLLLSLNRAKNNLMVVVTHSETVARSLDAAYEMRPGGSLTALF